MFTRTEVEGLQDDEGIAEALLRAADFDKNPDLGISLEQLDQQIERRRDLAG
ncbi:MAG: hypothetical protein WCD79_10655 [Chthoniobacteraceae bacterium]